MNPSSVSESIYNTTRLEGESGLYGNRPPESTTVSDASRYMQQAGSVPEEQTKTFTIDEALEQLGFGRTQVLMFFFCGMAWAGDGMEMMLLSYLGPELRCKWDLSSAQESWIASAVFIGMMAGSYTWGALSDAFGRRIGFLAPACFTALFGVASAFAPNYGTLILFRTLVGFGIAGAHVAYTLFMEFIAPGHRGVWLTAIESFWTVGSLFLAGMAWVVLRQGGLGWRGLVVIAAIPLVLLMALYPFMKESPHWLLANGKAAKAQEVLEWVAKLNRKDMLEGQLVHRATAEGHSQGNGHAHGSDRKGFSASAGFASIGEDETSNLPSARTQPSTATDAARTGNPVSRTIRSTFSGVASSTRHMFATRALAITTLLLVVIWFVTALAYYGMIMFNTTLQVDGEKCVDGSAIVPGSDYRNIFVTTIGEVAGLAVCLVLIDILGRKACMALFFVGTCAFLGPFLRSGAPSLSNDVTLDGTPIPPEVETVDVVMLFLLRMTTYATFIVLFIYTPEVYPTKVRSYAFGTFNAICRLGGLVGPFVGVDLFEKSGVRPTVLVFLITCAVAMVLAVLLPFETKGRVLAEDDSDLIQQQGHDADSVYQASSLDPTVSLPAGAAKVDLQMAALGSRGPGPGPGRLNPFHTDDVSGQIADSTAMVGDSRPGTGGNTDGRAPESLERGRV